MAVNPITSESLTVDFKSLMKIPVGDRMKAVNINPDFLQSILSALTPIQIANAFPNYYKRQLPDVSNFITSYITSRNGGNFNQTGGGAGGYSTGYYDTGNAVNGSARPAGAPPPTIEEMKETLLKKGIDVDNIYSTVKSGAVLENDKRLELLKGSSDEELKKMGFERFEDADGKSLIRLLPVPAESLTLEQAEQKLREESNLNAGLDTDSKLIKARTVKTSEALGIDQRQYNAFRQALANIESTGGEYGVIGGAGNKYSGAYQFGTPAMMDSARALGMNVPSREEFLKNPELQEQFLDQYTALNHKTLMRVSPEYQKMTPEERLGVLGYAHNQGAGGAADWLKTGTVGSDAFGTKGTKYVEAIRNQLNETKEQVVADPNKQYTKEEIEAYIDQLTEKQKQELIESGIRYQYEKGSPTSSDYVLAGNETQTVLTGNMDAIGGDSVVNRSQSRVSEQQQTLAGTRKMPLQEDLTNTMDYASQKISEESGKNIYLKVFSGGQAAIGTAGPRTGSTEHDLGGAADVYFVERLPDGSERTLSMKNPDDKALMYKAAYHFTRAGGRSIGLESGYMGDEAMHMGISRNSEDPVHHGDKELQALVDQGKSEFLQQARAEGWDPRYGYKSFFEKQRAERLAEYEKQKEAKALAEKAPEQTPPAPESAAVASATPAETPVPQFALGGNIYSPNEDLTIVETATGNPIAQVGQNEKIEKQGNAIQVTPETKLKADELTNKYDSSTEMEDRMSNIEDSIQNQTQQPVTNQVVQKAREPERVQQETPQRWRESIAMAERPVSPSFNRAMARTKFFGEGHHFNRSAPSSQS